MSCPVVFFNPTGIDSSSQGTLVSWRTKILGSPSTHLRRPGFLLWAKCTVRGISFHRRPFSDVSVLQSQMVIFLRSWSLVVFLLWFLVVLLWAWSSNLLSYYEICLLDVVSNLWGLSSNRSMVLNLWLDQGYWELFRTYNSWLICR